MEWLRAEKALLRDVYANSKASGFTSSFFHQAGHAGGLALLASPFYSTFEPIRLLTERKCQVRLLVRLCEITSPRSLKQAFDDPLVTVRYYTNRRFHAKLYIINDAALVGSANLTDSGLNANREVSVVLLRGRDQGFEELPGLFDLLWDGADVLTERVLEQYEKAHAKGSPGRGDEDFDNLLGEFVEPCEPPNIRVESGEVSHRRSFLQTFRRKYDESLHPAFGEVRSVFEAAGQHRREFDAGRIDIEISRFLGWLRVVHARGEAWAESPLLASAPRLALVERFRRDWDVAADISAGDMIQVEGEVDNVRAIEAAFASPEAINALSYDELFDVLVGCHAFREMLRFTKGGLPGLRADFSRRNSLADIKRTLTHLTNGAGDPLERAYDCIFDERFRLGRFGEACVMELLGWVEPAYPPVNGRTIKALRFLGFDVENAAPAEG